MIGQTFNRWTVLGKSDRKPFHMRCQCLCGTQREVFKYDLISNKSHSCGCHDREVLIKRNTSHGMCGTRVYQIWKAMKSRCYNPKNQDYSLYGGRGLTVSHRWLEAFENFLEDMGIPEPHKSIGRIDNNKGYSLANCRWEDNTQQRNNTRRNHFVEHGGKRLTLAQWEDETGICQKLLRHRLRKGWTPQRAIETPVMRRKTRHY